MSLEPVTVPNEILFAHAKQLIDLGHDVTLTVVGHSMQPFFEGYREDVKLEKCEKAKANDFVLALTDEGRYVAHRVVYADEERIIMRGDGNVYGKEHAKQENIVGLSPHGRQRRIQENVFVEMETVHDVVASQSVGATTVSGVPSSCISQNVVAFGEARMDENRKDKRNMKLDGSFELKTLAGQSIGVPGKLKNVDFTNLLTLNETAAVVWERMTQGEFEVDDLVKALTDAYEVDEAQAREDVVALLAKIRELGMIEE